MGLFWVKKLIDAKLVKFLIIGMVNTAIGAGVMFLLYNLVHCSYWVSSACNYIVGGIVSFFLNKYFTFKNTQKSLKQIGLFVFNLAVCYIAAYILAKWMIYRMLANQSENIKDNIALFLGMCIYTGLNYIGQRLIVFKEA
jgi:predicted membrane protein